MPRSLLLVSTLAWLLLCASARAGSVEEGLEEVTHDWEVIRYQTPAREREARFEALLAKAHRLSESHPELCAPRVWEGIVAGSLADEKNPLLAPRLFRRARALFEEALKLDPDALDGLAWDELGALYHRAYRWPLSFRDDDKAGELLRRGLAADPNGIDANFLYGELLLANDRAADAVPYLERAVAAVPRPGRQIADYGRREEARQLLAKALSQAGR